MFYFCLLIFSTLIIFQVQCRSMIPSPGCMYCKFRCPTDDDCAHGRIIDDECGCCDDGICAKGAGESCGGRWNLAGLCADNRKCVPQHPRFRQMPGICEDVKQQNSNVF